MTFRRLKHNQLPTVTRLLDKASQQLTYFDPNKNKIITIETYSGDYEVTYDGLDQPESFDCALIARARRQ